VSRSVLEGPVVGSEGVKVEQLVLENGRVTQRGDLGLKADHQWSQDCLLFPGFGDIHVHLREGQEYKEDFHTGSEAALNGGVTFCCDMPNNPTPPLDQDTFSAKVAKLPDHPVHIELYAALGPGTRPFGCRRYKGFLAHSTGPLYFESLLEAREVVKEYGGCRITFHCEDPVILEGAKGAPNHEESRPAQAEAEAVRHVLRWVEEFGIIANVAHLSTEAALREVYERTDVTFELTPHHLFFDVENRNRFERGKLLKMNPPLRRPSDRKALLKSLKEGRANFLATDHAPHTLEEKLSGSPPSGVPLLDTYGAFVTWLLKTEGVSPQIVHQVCCSGPAQFLELPDRGHLSPGARADVTVLNLARPHTVKREQLATKCGWSPFEGVTFPGSVEAVFVGGEKVR